MTHHIHDNRKLYVRLKPDALQLHSRSIPAHMGYPQSTIVWRSELSKHQDKRTVGDCSFQGKNRSSVRFDGTLYDIPNYMLEEVTDANA